MRASGDGGFFMSGINKRGGRHKGTASFILFEVVWCMQTTLIYHS